MSIQLHSRLIAVTLSLYLIATWCSMAGMELFGWLTVLLTLALTIRARVTTPRTAQDGAAANHGGNETRGAQGDPARFADLPDLPPLPNFASIEKFLPWKTFVALFSIAALGFAINGTSSADPLYGLGSLRWMVLVTFISLAFVISPPSLKGYRVFLVFTSLVALYAVFQSFTGIDFMRPGENRAVQPISLTGAQTLWRSAGFFGSPLQYGYIAGQHVCLALAMVLLLWKARQTRGWMFWGSAIAYVLISLSIVTTYTRGAWLAMAAAHVTLAMIVSPRFGVALASAGATALMVLIASVEQLRLRFLTLFDPAYASNSERWFLWKANFEMFKDYPILGIGYLENETRAREYVTRLGQPDHFTGHAHNNYLQMLAGTGLFGFAAYLFIISFMLWLTWRLWRSLPEQALWPRAIALAALGAQLQLHIGGLTECNFKAGATNHNLMVVWALVVALSALQMRGNLAAFFGASPFGTKRSQANKQNR